MAAVTGARRPRLAQIEVLVGGYDLPLPAIDPEILQAIAEAISHAIDTLSREGYSELQSGTEAEVNGLIRGRLNAFLHPSTNTDQHDNLIRTLWRQLVKLVSLGQETPSYDGRHLEKRPDLNIHLAAGHPSLPLVAECKLIDIADAKTPKRYCDEGVARFPTGEYGWAHKQAFMVAYVRDGSQPLPSLGQLLRVPRAKSPLDAYQVLQAPTAMTDTSLLLLRSTHGRSFTYTTGATMNMEPGPIELWHLWLVVP